MTPYHEAYLPVTQGHRLYYAQFGNPQGVPLLFIHGGPGSGCNPAHAKLLQPERFRIIQFDQRGCGRSTPSGSVLGNRTDTLLEDIEQLRVELRIEQWAVYGGSWGATLALEYAKAHPERLQGLLLRGAFLAREEDWHWFSSPEGIACQLAEASQALCRTLGCSADACLATTLHLRLFDPQASLAQRYRAAHAWDCWEAAVMGLPASPCSNDPKEQQRRVDRLRIYAHYALHRWFLPPEGVLLELDRISHLPVTLVHGVNDQVCTFSSAQLLAKAVPQLKLLPVEAGHGMNEAEIQAGLQQALSGFA